MKWLFGAIFGALYAPLVITGLHHMTNAIDTQLIADAGGTGLWPMIALSNIAQGSAVLAFYFMNRHDEHEAQISLPAAISAYLGVTEPALFGVNLKYVYPFVAGMIGSGLADIFCTSFNITANAIGIGGLPGILSIQAKYMGLFAINMLITVAVPFMLTYVFRNKGATMLAAAIHLSRGTPYIYMGEEIGMLDPDYDSMADYVDVESLNAYQTLLKSGKTEAEAFAIICAKSRDNSRIPMQWDASKNAGFSTGKPWLKVGKTYRDINVENEKNGPIFSFYQKLIRLRKDMPIIAEGNYQSAYQTHPKIYAFERHLGDESLLVLNNFFATEVEIDLPKYYQFGKILLSNYPAENLSSKITLKPYQTLAIYQEKSDSKDNCQ